MSEAGTNLSYQGERAVSTNGRREIGLPALSQDLAERDILTAGRRGS